MTTIPDIILNTDKEKLYEGDLKVYFEALFEKAKNVLCPYHNIRHMLHVMYMCYDALRFYHGQIDPKDARKLLIAAMFHDFDHTGRTGYDDLNIVYAVRGLRANIEQSDSKDLNEIELLMGVTEYPYKHEDHDLTLLERIICDADLSQAFSNCWIRQVIFGLGTETGLGPRKMLEAQKTFLGNIVLRTEWAKDRFGEAISGKIAEAEKLLLCLE